MVVNQKCDDYDDDDVDVDDDDDGGGGGAAVLSKFNDTVILTKNNTDVAGNGKEWVFLPFGIQWQCHKFVMV